MRDIPNYTRRQMRLFFREVQREKGRDRAAMISDVNLSFNGGDEANKMIKKLTAD